MHCGKPYLYLQAMNFRLPPTPLGGSVAPDGNQTSPPKNPIYGQCLLQLNNCACCSQDDIEKVFDQSENILEDLGTLIDVFISNVSNQAFKITDAVCSKIAEDEPLDNKKMKQLYSPPTCILEHKTEKAAIEACTQQLKEKLLSVIEKHI